jgi:phosphomannomutase
VSPVRFGTSGWRGVLADEFTFERARAVVSAIAVWAQARDPGGRFVVAHDTRFLGARLAAEAAALLAGEGLRVVRGAGPLPTPVAAHSVRRLRAAGAIVFTASHNPSEYQGLKFLAADGAPAAPDVLREIESRVEAILAGGGVAAAGAAAGPLERGTAYRRELLALLDRRRLRGSGLTVVYDALHGTGAGFLDRVLEDAGLRVRARRLGRDPDFGGGAPDPQPERLRELGRELRGLRGPRLGLATDGDADRFAALDERGRALSPADGLALLVDHAARTGRAERGLVLSWAAGSLPGRVAEAHGLAVERQPVGFKHLARAFAGGRADLAGDESGGFALGSFGRDKDGILAGCLLAECVAASGGSLAGALRALRRAHGASAWGQRALRRDEPADAALARLSARPPEQVAGARVLAVSELDGLRLELADGFVLWRASGTEPLVRVYAEARTRSGLARRLRAAARLAGGPTSGAGVFRRARVAAS